MTYVLQVFVLASATNTLTASSRKVTGSQSRDENLSYPQLEHLKATGAATVIVPHT